MPADLCKKIICFQGGQAESNLDNAMASATAVSIAVDNTVETFTNYAATDEQVERLTTIMATLVRRSARVQTPTDSEITKVNKCLDSLLELNLEVVMANDTSGASEA